MAWPAPRTTIRITIRGLASAAWLLAGLAKIIFPSEARIGSAILSEEWVLGIGAYELLLAAAWWIPRLRRFGALTGLATVLIFATAMLAGWVSPETCGCFGELKVSEARHKFALGLLAILGSLGLLLEDPQELPDETHQP